MSAKGQTEKKTKHAQSISPTEILTGKEPVEISTAGYADWIRSLLQGWRQGTVAVKGRADVARSGKKPWKQKGTGRARAGTARSPLWRGGGVTFGPQKRVRKLKVGKKVKERVFLNVLHNYLKSGRVVQLDWAAPEKPKTEKAIEALKKLNLHDKKIVLFLSFEDKITFASFANLPNTTILYFDQPNVFDLSTAEYWVILKKDMDKFKEMVSQWI